MINSPVDYTHTKTSETQHSPMDDEKSLREKANLAKASRARCPPDKLTPLSPIHVLSPPTISEISTSNVQALNVSKYLV